MPALLEAVRRALKRSANTQTFDPLSPEKLAAFERRLPAPIPSDVRELLSFCSGFADCIADFVDLTGEMASYEQPDIFPTGLPIAGDGFGNFWVVDLRPGATSWSPIYFACHDPPVIVFHTASLQDFLVENLALDEERPNSFDPVHEDHPFEIWKSNPGLLSRSDCLNGGDAVLQTFAEPLSAELHFVDLRAAKLGDGFSWGRYGPHTRVVRHPSQPIFAYGRP